jgi:hypothetical protein
MIMCHDSTANLWAVATVAICILRRALTRSKNARSGMGVLTATQAASTSMPRARAALPGDPAMRVPLIAGLLDPRVQAGVAHQPVGRVEAGEVADGGGDRHRNGHIDPGDRHQPPDVPATQRDPASAGSISRSSWPW